MIVIAKLVYLNLSYLEYLAKARVCVKIIRYLVPKVSRLWLIDSGLYTALIGGKLEHEAVA